MPQIKTNKVWKVKQRQSYVIQTKAFALGAADPDLITGRICGHSHTLSRVILESRVQNRSLSLTTSKKLC